LPKEVLKKTFGISTQNVAYSPQVSTIRRDVGVRWGQDKKLKATTVTEITGWEKRVAKELDASDRLSQELLRRHPDKERPLNVSLSVPSDIGMPIFCNASLT
jgi:hypothetical protein